MTGKKIFDVMDAIQSAGEELAVAGGEVMLGQNNLANAIKLLKGVAENLNQRLTALEQKQTDQERSWPEGDAP